MKEPRTTEVEKKKKNTSTQLSVISEKQALLLKIPTNLESKDELMEAVLGSLLL